MKSYFRIGQMAGRAVTVAMVTNKHVWLPEALPLKMMAFVTKFMNFTSLVSPLFTFKVSSNELHIIYSPSQLRFGVNPGPHPRLCCAQCLVCSSNLL